MKHVKSPEMRLRVAKHLCKVKHSGLSYYLGWSDLTEEAQEDFLKEAKEIIALIRGEGVG